ncbi:hypothetical protein ColTof4_14383 [Colletotrichum tofieldiae]|nr:hypothetical protein ColTof3_14795 [Colletotrichum tofieldiae]GKT81960.1 hypothetical protein ColTof4_14383 [Colletotrichum tofieldiae]
MSHQRLMSTTINRYSPKFDEERVRKYSSRGFKEVKLSQFKNTSSLLDPSLAWNRTIRSPWDRDAMVVTYNPERTLGGKYSSVIPKVRDYDLTTSRQEETDELEPLVATPELVREG